MLFTSAASTAYLGVALVPNPPLVYGNLLLTNVQTTAAAQTAATAVQFVQMNTSGAIVQTYAVPSVSGTSPCTLSGSPAEGRLAASISGNFFSFACYAAATGTTGISSSSAAVRAISSISLDANVQGTLSASAAILSGKRVFSAAVFDAAGNAYLAGQTGNNGWDVFNIGTGAGA